MFTINIDNYYGEPQSYVIENIEDLKQLLFKYHLNTPEFINNLKNPRILADKFVRKISKSHITATINDPEDDEELEDIHYEGKKKPTSITTLSDVKNLLEAPEDDVVEVEIPEHIVLQHSVNRY